MVKPAFFSSNLFLPNLVDEPAANTIRQIKVPTHVPNFLGDKKFPLPLFQTLKLKGRAR
ncbi:MAG: hypothetical protein ACTSQM_05380 [Candidatus Odinarchaeia archaeon]